MKGGSEADLENKLAVTVGRGRGNTGWERGGHRLLGVRQHGEDSQYFVITVNGK